MRLARITRSLTLTSVVALALHTGSAGAQIAPASSPARAPHASCLDAIPQSAMSRVLAYIWSESDDTSRAVRNSGGMIAESVADRLRAILGDSGNTVPRGDARLNWRQLDGYVRVVLRRSSGISVASPPDSLADDTTAGAAPNNHAGIRMLAEAVRQLSSERAFELWPPNVPGESLAFRFELVTPKVEHDGTVKPLSVAPAVPVFTLEQPWIDGVRVVDTVLPRYPDDPHNANVMGGVMLAFIVDTSGRADSTTIHDVWPLDRPRPSGTAAADYRAFYASAREAVLRSTFAPSTIGGCRVRQLVQQPYAFVLNR